MEDGLLDIVNIKRDNFLCTTIEIFGNELQTDIVLKVNVAVEK